MTSRRRTCVSNALTGFVKMKFGATTNRSSAVLWMLAVVCSWAALLSARSVDATSEKRLITMLLENYRQNGVDGRPVLNTSATLPVTISFSLIQILQFDPVANVIALVGWTSLRWRDVLLRWNAYEFDNIRQVVLRPDQIWTPDIVLFNAISPPRIIHDTRLIVAQNGDILWTTHAQYQLTCSPAAGSATPIQPLPSVPQPPAAWPRGGGAYYDGPGMFSVPTECQLRFGSWTLSADLLRLQSTPSFPAASAGDGGSPAVQPRGRLLSQSISSGTVPSMSLVPGPFARDRSAGLVSSQQPTTAGDGYVPNADWDLNSLAALDHEVEYPCCPGRRYADVTYSFRLVRRSVTSSRGHGQGPRDVRSRDAGQETQAASAGRRYVGKKESSTGSEMLGNEGSDGWPSANWPEVELDSRFATSSGAAMEVWRELLFMCCTLTFPAIVHLHLSKFERF